MILLCDTSQSEEEGPGVPKMTANRRVLPKVLLDCRSVDETTVEVLTVIFPLDGRTDDFSVVPNYLSAKIERAPSIPNKIR